MLNKYQNMSKEELDFFTTVIKPTKLALFLDDKGLDIYTDGLIDNQKISAIAKSLGGVFDPENTEWRMPIASYDADMYYGKDVFFMLTKEDIEIVFDLSNQLNDFGLQEKEKELFIDAMFHIARDKFEVDWEDLSGFMESTAINFLPHFKLELEVNKLLENK